MSSWILDFLHPASEAIADAIKDDTALAAAARANINGTVRPLRFGIASSDTDGTQDTWAVIELSPSVDDKVTCKISPGSATMADFFLKARPSDWEAFFKKDTELVRPYQSYWGMLRVLGPLHPEEFGIVGDVGAFGRYARIWRIVLDRIRDTLNRKTSVTERVQLPQGEETEEDAVVGRYIWISHSNYGKVKIFYETSGIGSQVLLFLHTAGSDSRQYHSLMNDSILREKCRMVAFDLPAHGRSSLGTNQLPESYALTEEAYIESISLVIQKLDLTVNDNLIICGASMAGHVCLAAAIVARKLGVRGSIPCEGCAHLPLTQPIYEIKGNDSAVLDPERVCGMIAPTSPEYHKRQIWWQYSSQGTNIFAGDLKFYFRGWDGRGRLEGIDTEYCPVYMLTGEYDYSCTAEASLETAEMIKGAVFEEMKGLGHFPLTENPKAVIPYLMRAIEHIQKTRV